MKSLRPVSLRPVHAKPVKPINIYRLYLKYKITGTICIQLMAMSEGLTGGQKAVIAVLLIIPLVAYVAIDTYNRASPELAGVPFFYWYQMLWLVISSVLFGVAAYLWELWLSRGQKR